ncbi:MAG: type II toxin-antitoxin system VapC family toxin [Gammaproteobacteria bacterium]|nr:type II toxin-antitoxin system VapC family toxin [Gammaproteobacteria bacterium]
MKPVFVDTVALIAVGDKDDGLHKEAIRIRKQLIIEKRAFITTDAVLLELCNAFSYPDKNLRQIAIAMIEDINNSKRWTRIEADRALMDRGFEKFKKMQDKSWSLVDCIGMVVAEDYRITDIFTANGDFNQAGFLTLLSAERS